MFNRLLEVFDKAHDIEYSKICQESCFVKLHELVFLIAVYIFLNVSTALRSHISISLEL